MPLFIDINGPEFLILLVLAIVLFGPEKLPELARKTARVVRYVRAMAGNAQQQISQELGPEFSDLDVRDLNPRTFVQKHLLDDVQPIVADVKREITDVRTTVKASPGEVAGAIEGAKTVSPGGPAPVAAPTPYDADAT